MLPDSLQPNSFKDDVRAVLWTSLNQSINYNLFAPWKQYMFVCQFILFI